MQAKSQRNPFFISGYESPDTFCDREEESARIMNALSNGRNILLISLRRMGKTGLLFHAKRELEKKKIICFYVDLLSTDSAESFTLALSREVVGVFEKPIEKWAQRISTVFRNIIPTITFDAVTGQPSLELKLGSSASATRTLEELFEFLALQKQQVVVALDEFQQITNYPQKSFEATLRTLCQKYNNIRFIFSGSEQHVLGQMFTYSKRPFYQSAEVLELKPINPAIYKNFIRRHFKKSGRVISNDALDFIFNWTWGHTYYVQYFCNRLYSNQFLEADEISIRMLALKLLEEQESIFNTYKQIIPPGQWNLLKAISKEEEGARKLFSGEFIKRHQLGTTGSIRNLLKGLLAKQMIFQQEDRYFCYDRFLGRWLQRQ